MQQRKWMSFLVALALVVAWNAEAQALSISVDGARRARVVESGNTVAFVGKNRRSRAAFTATLDSSGIADIVVKRRGKRAKRFSMNVAAGDTQFAYRGRKRVFMTFTESGTTGSPVPEPGTLAMLGLGLAGLAARGRRRS